MLKDRLKQLRFTSGMSQAELAEKANVSQSTITFLESGRNTTSKKLPEIAKALNTTVEYLIYGESSAPKSTGDQQDFSHNGKLSFPEDLVAVPFLNGCSLSAGTGALNDQQTYDGDVLYLSRKFLRERNILPDKVFSISVKGDSMEPRFYEGDTVFIDTDDVNVVDGRVYAVSYLGQDYIKKLSRAPTGGFMVISENNIYKIFEASTEDIIIFGRVIASQREE